MSDGLTVRDINKGIVVVVAVIAGTLGLGLFSDLLYAPDVADPPGYALPTSAAPPAPVAKAEAPAAGAKAEAPVALAGLLTKANAKAGEAGTKACQACHNFEKGGAAKVGPPLWGVVGRPKGSIAGFAYSDGMKAKGGNWGYEELFAFIKKPSAYVSGTKMAYPGEADDSKRADILAYLQTLNDSPVPFPK